MTTLEWNYSALHDLLDSPNGELGRLTQRIALRTRTNAEQAAVAKTKRSDRNHLHYRDSFGVRSLGGVNREIYSSSEVAAWLELGTQPHIISPRPGGALRFVIGGRVVFVKHPRVVHHPGTKPLSILTNALFDAVKSET